MWDVILGENVTIGVDVTMDMTLGVNVIVGMVMTMDGTVVTKLTAVLGMTVGCDSWHECDCQRGCDWDVFLGMNKIVGEGVTVGCDSGCECDCRSGLDCRM